MPAILFWLLVIAVVLFLQLTTKAQRQAMIETYWLIIIALGAVGFIWQFLRQGTISA
jgi:Na+-transporting methylmalonyl-CoA/oxaloacetate decarboxylase beta subunit